MGAELDESLRARMVGETAAEEASLLGAWCRGFEAFYGRAPEILRHPFAPDSLPAASVIRLPDVFTQPAMVGSIGHFKHRPGLVTHMRRMGYDWTETGHVIQAPTPATYNRLRDLWGFSSAGYVACLTVRDEARMSLGAWLLLYLDGIIPISVASGERYAMLSPRSNLAATPWGSEGKVRNHLQFLPHDLTLHAQNYHLVPRAALQVIKTMVCDALPERVVSWSQPGALAPLTLTYFLDNDFNRYAYQIWCECQRPEDFEAMYLRPEFFDQLKEALLLRIEETRRGVGDVASGRTEEMRPLQPFEFRISAGRRGRGT